MASLGDLQEYRAAAASVVDAARMDLMDLYRSLQGNDPAVIRDALLEYVPVLTEQYGDVAAALAAEWFESLPTMGWATLQPPVPRAITEGQLRYRAGGLWRPDGTPSGLSEAAAVIGTIAGDLDEWVQRPARGTVRESAEANGFGWVRVPRGDKTCAFCLMLASRSGLWLYRTRETAQRRGRGQTEDKYHDHCDCQIVPAGSTDDVPWDPEPFFRVYEAAVDVVGNRSDTASILAQIRRVAPDAVTDGVHPPAPDVDDD